MWKLKDRLIPPQSSYEYDRFLAELCRYVNDYQEMTASGAVGDWVQHLEVKHATTVVAATIADASTHRGLFVVKNTSASGTVAHTVTIASGTWDGTNNVLTFSLPDQLALIFFDSAGNGSVLLTIGVVSFS